MQTLLMAVHTLNHDTDLQTMNDRVLGNLSTGVLLVNEAMQVVYSNTAAENLLGESFGQMRGKCLSGIFANSDELISMAEEAWRSNHLITSRQAQLILPGKSRVTADVTMTPILEAHQMLIELIPMDRYLRIDRDAAIKEHHDVTRRMVRGLAHEIKNPLGGIKGSAQLLARELPEEGFSEYTNIIIEETDRLTSLVDRMLGPNTPPQKSMITIHEVLERAAKLIEFESTGLTVIRDYDPSIPLLGMDPELMTQALLNLVRNSMQALEDRPHPTITLTTRVERQFTISGQRHKVVVRLEIRDNGPGIPDEIRDHLFYPMISKRPDGTGLGLTFAQSIISRHGGMIEFDSEPGETVFTVFLPLLPESANPASERLQELAEDEQ